MPEYSAILVVQTAFPGDVILTLPLLQALRRAYPRAAIDLLAIPAAAELLSHHPAVRETLIYDKKGSQGGMSGFLAQVKRIRSRHYDLAVIPHRSLRSALLAWWGRIPVRVGFTTSAGRLFFTARVPHESSLHEVDRNLSLLTGLGLAVQPRELPRLYPSAAEKRRVDEIFEAEGIAGSLVAVAPGSVWETKRWPADRYASLCRALVQAGHTVLLIGGNEDATLCSEIAATSSSSRVVSLAGRLSLLQSAEAIRRCRLLVSNDSAPMHLAVAMETPVVAIFGPTVPRFGFTPIGEGDRVVETEGLACRPCGPHGGARCPIGTFECMLAISPDRVYQEIQAMPSDQFRGS